MAERVDRKVGPITRVAIAGVALWGLYQGSKQLTESTRVDAHSIGNEPGKGLLKSTPEEEVFPPFECGSVTPEGFLTHGMVERVGGDEPGEGKVFICSSEDDEWHEANSPWRKGESPQGLPGYVFKDDIPGDHPETNTLLKDEEGNVIVLRLKDGKVTPDGEPHVGVASVDGLGWVPVQQLPQRFPKR